MRFIGGGSYTLAYYSPNTKNVLLYSVDKTKDIMSKLSGQSKYLPKLEKVAEGIYNEREIFVYRTDKLVNITNVRSRYKYFINRQYQLLERCFVYSSLIGAKEQFRIWMENINKYSILHIYKEALSLQFDTLYDAFGDDLNFDFAKRNFMTKHFDSILIFNDLYHLESLWPMPKCHHYWLRKIYYE